jgi:hypothetical protein
MTGSTSIIELGMTTVPNMDVHESYSGSWNASHIQCGTLQRIASMDGMAGDDTAMLDDNVGRDSPDHRSCSSLLIGPGHYHRRPMMLPINAGP